MHLIRKLAAVATIATMITVTTSQPVAAKATADSDEPTVSAAAASGFGFTTALATGTVFSHTGEVQDGASISVYAEPGMATLRGLKEGDSYERSLIGSAVSDAQGTYSIRPDYAALTEAVGASSAREPIPVNVTITVEAPGAFTAYGATVEYSPGNEFATMTPLGAPAGADAPAAPVTSGSELDFHLEKVERAPASDALAAASVPSNCTLVTNLGARDVYVGQLSSTVSGGFSHDWLYTSGADTIIGMGYSISGNAGTWSQSGTSVASSTSTTNFPASSSSGSQLMVTKFTFAKVRCWAGTTSTQYYQVRPTDYYGGATTTTTTTPSATNCAPYLANSSFSRTTSNAVTYSNGVQISSVIGINLSAQTGFRTDAKYTVTFTSTRHLCGKSSGPGGSGPSQIVVKP